MKPTKPTIVPMNEDTSPEESVEQDPTVDRQKQLQHNKEVRAYLKNQMEFLKPQVELIELKARHAKATYENYTYSMKLHEIQRQEDEAATAQATPPPTEPTTGTPVVNINQTTSSTDGTSSQQAQ